MITLRFISETAPPTPPCFPSRDQWVEYLHSCQECEKSAADRPFDKRGIYKPEFDFCVDCTKEHFLSMHSKARCKPRFLQAAVHVGNPKKVAA